MRKVFKEFIKDSLKDKILNELLLTERVFDVSSKISISSYSIKGFYLHELINNDIGLDIGINAEFIKSGLEETITYIQTFILYGVLEIKNNKLNLSINTIKKVKNLKDYNLINNLVPYIKKEQMEELAEKILKYIYPVALEGKPVYTDEFAKRLGLHIETATFSDPNIMGRIYFEDYIPKIGEPNGNFQKKIIKENTLMVNTSLLGKNNYGTFNFTIMHECVHFLLHKRCFLLECLIKQSPKVLECLYDDKGIMRNPTIDIDTIEWQANSLAPKLLLPAKALEKKVLDMLNDFISKKPHSNLLDYYEPMMNSLGYFYGVYPQAIKLRLLELGFQFPLGCFIYVDGKKIPTHVCKLGYLKNNQTFCISVNDLIEYVNSIEDPLLFRRFIYVDSHLCINSDKFVEIINGVPQLNYYARTKMDLCCVKFYVDLIPCTNTKDKDYKSFRILNRTKDNKSKLIVKGISNDRVLETTEINEVVEICFELEKLLTNTPSECIRIIKDYFNYTIDDLVRISGLSKHTLQNYLYRNDHYDKKSLIRLLLAMRTPGNVILEVLAKAGFVLNPHLPEDGVLKIVILLMWSYPFEKIVEFLKSYGIEI